MEKVPHIDLFSSAQKWRTNHFQTISNQINSNTYPYFHKYSQQTYQTNNQRATSANSKNNQRPFITNYYDQAIKIVAGNTIAHGITSPIYSQLKKFDFIKTNNCQCNYQNRYHQHEHILPPKQQDPERNKQRQNTNKNLKISLNQIREQSNSQSESFSTTKYMDNVSDLVSKQETIRRQKQGSDFCQISARSKGSNFLSPRDHLKQTAQFKSKESIKNDICLQKTNSKKIVSFKQISNAVINSQILDPQRVSPPSLRKQSKDVNPSSNQHLPSNKHLNSIRVNKLVFNFQTDLNKRIKQLSTTDNQAFNKQLMLQQLNQMKEQNIMMNKQFVMKLDHILIGHDEKNQKQGFRTLQMSKSAGSFRRKKLFVTQAEL